MNISAVIIALNEEENLERCLNSIKWVDEIIVIDSGSTDRTKEIALKAGARVYDVEWKGFGQAKKYGVSMAKGAWILSLDADEEITPGLAEEIQATLRDGDTFPAYYMPRRTMFLGRWISHCGWYPDRVLRLFLKSRANFNEATVHEKVIFDDPAGYLKNEIRHYSYPTLEHYLRKFNRYTTLGAEEACRSGKKGGWLALLIKPPAAFFKHYIARQGFRDGWEGFVISVLSCAAVFVKYTKLRDMNRKNRER
jgi:(heptosyl)LPS beta-1,4-glucosyltransferase